MRDLSCLWFREFFDIKLNLSLSNSIYKSSVASTRSKFIEWMKNLYSGYGIEYWIIMRFRSLSLVRKKSSLQLSIEIQRI